MILTKKQLNRKQLLKLSREAQFGRLCASFFHDLVNPLTGLILRIETLKKLKQLNPEIKDIIDSTRNLEEYLLVFKDMLDSRPNIESFNLETEINNCIRLLSHRIKKTNTTIVLNPKRKIIYTGDKTIFSHIIISLLELIISKDTHKKMVEIKITDYPNKNIRIKSDSKLKQTEEFKSLNIIIKQHSMGSLTINENIATLNLK